MGCAGAGDTTEGPWSHEETRLSVSLTQRLSVVLAAVRLGLSWATKWSVLLASCSAMVQARELLEEVRGEGRGRVVQAPGGEPG